MLYTADNCPDSHWKKVEFATIWKKLVLFINKNLCSKDICFVRLRADLRRQVRSASATPHHPPSEQCTTEVTSQYRWTHAAGAGHSSGRYASFPDLFHIF